VKLALAVLVAALAGAAPTSTLPIEATVAPDGTHIAWVDGTTWQVWTARADGSDPRKLGPSFARDGVGQIRWTQEGLVLDTNYTLYLLTQGGKLVKIGAVGDQVFSVGGTRAATGSAPCGYCKGPVIAYDIRTHAAVRLGDRTKANGDAALSPDGSRVAYSSPRGIVVQSLRGGAPRSLHVGGGCSAWSPDGRSLSFYGAGAELEVVPVTGGRPVVVAKRVGCREPAMTAWSPDSKTIAFPYGPDRLALVDMKTHAVRKTPRSLGRVTTFAWTPDGSALVATFRNDSCGNVDRIDARTLAATVLVRGCP
jgi:WD40 repeat protein